MDHRHLQYLQPCQLPNGFLQFVNLFCKYETEHISGTEFETWKFITVTSQNVNNNKTQSNAVLLIYPAAGWITWWFLIHPSSLRNSVSDWLVVIHPAGKWITFLHSRLALAPRKILRALPLSFLNAMWIKLCYFLIWIAVEQIGMTLVNPLTEYGSSHV